MIDAAFNAAVTAWHLRDWVFADLTDAQRTRLQIRSLKQMQAHARKCRAVRLCRVAATASKHWKVTDHPGPTVSVIVTATPIPGAHSRALPLHITQEWHVYFVDRNGIIAARDVFELALEFWTQFIYPNDIAKNPAAPPC